MIVSEKIQRKKEYMFKSGSVTNVKIIKICGDIATLTMRTGQRVSCTLGASIRKKHYLLAHLKKILPFNFILLYQYDSLPGGGTLHEAARSMKNCGEAHWSWTNTSRKDVIKQAENAAAVDKQAELVYISHVKNDKYRIRFLKCNSIIYLYCVLVLLDDK